MRLQEMMTSPVETVATVTSVTEALDYMHARKIHHLVVVEGKKLVGIVSEYELKNLDGGQTVEEAMFADPPTAKATMQLREAANILRGRTVGCIVVLDNDSRPIGIVTISDVLGLIGKGLDRTAPRTERRPIWKRGPRRKPAP